MSLACYWLLSGQKSLKLWNIRCQEGISIDWEIENVMRRVRVESGKKEHTFT